MLFSAFPEGTSAISPVLFQLKFKSVVARQLPGKNPQRKSRCNGGAAGQARAAIAAAPAAVNSAIRSRGVEWLTSASPTRMALAPLAA